MSTLIDEPTPLVQQSEASLHLRTTMAAMRVSFTWFGTRKALSADQKAQAAESFGAEEQYLSAAKKLLNTKHEKYRALTSLRSQAITYWKSISLPYPEAGVRLIQQGDLDGINRQMRQFKRLLDAAVSELNDHYDDLKTAARIRLGRLFNPTDYPDSLLGLFDMSWEYPSIEPPEYLQRLNPHVYQQECERIAARFDEAVELAERAFSEELTKLVTHLSERLSGEHDGKPKVFRDTAISNLTEFFQRFRHLNIRSNQQLDALVQQAEQVMQGVQPQQLRDNHDLRQQVATEMGEVQTALDDLLMDRPRRNILRRPK